MQDSFIAALASPDQPIPGGGAAAAYAGSVALALLKKIVRVEMRRHQGISEDSPWEDLLDQVSALGQNLYRLSDEDGRSYLRLAEVKNSGQSEKEVASALKEAIECPMKIMEQAYEALSCVSQTAKNCKAHLLSDLQVVCELLGAAGGGAYHITRANLRLTADPILKTDYQNRLNNLYDYGTEALKQAQDSILQSYDKF